MEIVKAQFPLQPNTNEETYRHANCRTGNIERSKHLVPTKIAPRRDN
jgi:hypothetical protein